MMSGLQMMPHNTGGFLITFCGLDGCGKSTMINMLRDKLIADGYDVMVTKQPTDQMRQSEIFRTYMDEPDHSMFEYRTLSLMAAADRVQHVNKVILPELKKGKIVICDRYFYSCLANLRARGYEDDKWIYDVSKAIIKPDIAFFLDVSVPVAVFRVRSRPEERDRYIDMDLQYRLCEEYREIAVVNQGFLLPSHGSPEMTFETIYDYVRRSLKCKKKKNQCKNKQI